MDELLLSTDVPSAAQISSNTKQNTQASVHVEVKATKLESKPEQVEKRLTKNVPPSGYGPEVWQPMDAHAVDECVKEQDAKMHGNDNILAYKVSATRLPTRPKKNNHL